MMATLLSLLLLVQFFTPAQEQVASAATTPLEVLDLEVLMYEWKIPAIRNPGHTPPPGPVNAQDITGVRGTTTGREQPTIERRSRDLAKVGKETPASSQPVSRPASTRYSYQYRVRVKNTGPKKTKSIIWEYQLTDSSGTEVISQRLFLCSATVKPDTVKLLQAGTLAPPNRVVSADPADQSQKQKAVINRVEYSDGTRWIREGWKPDDSTLRDEAKKRRDLGDGQCTLL